MSHMVNGDLHLLDFSPTVPEPEERTGYPPSSGFRDILQRRMSCRERLSKSPFFPLEPT